MFQSVNLVWRIAVQNVGCVLAHFCADTIIIFRYDFGAPLNNS